MKLISVIVDKVPDKCSNCDFERFDGNKGSFCVFEEVGELYRSDMPDSNKRHPSCPLVPDLESLVK